MSYKRQASVKYVQKEDAQIINNEQYDDDKNYHSNNNQQQYVVNNNNNKNQNGQKLPKVTQNFRYKEKAPMKIDLNNDNMDNNNNCQDYYQNDSPQQKQQYQNRGNSNNNSKIITNSSNGNNLYQLKSPKSNINQSSDEYQLYQKPKQNNSKKQKLKKGASAIYQVKSPKFSQNGDNDSDINKSNNNFDSFSNSGEQQKQSKNRSQKNRRNFKSPDLFQSKNNNNNNNNNNSRNYFKSNNNNNNDGNNSKNLRKSVSQNKKLLKQNSNSNVCYIQKTDNHSSSSANQQQQPKKQFFYKIKDSSNENQKEEKEAEEEKYNSMVEQEQQSNGHNNNNGQQENTYKIPNDVDLFKSLEVSSQQQSENKNIQQQTEEETLRPLEEENNLNNNNTNDEQLQQFKKNNIANDKFEETKRPENDQIKKKDACNELLQISDNNSNINSNNANSNTSNNVSIGNNNDNYISFSIQDVSSLVKSEIQTINASNLEQSDIQALEQQQQQIIIEKDEEEDEQDQQQQQQKEQHQEKQQKQGSFLKNLFKDIKVAQNKNNLKQLQDIETKVYKSNSERIQDFQKLFKQAQSSFSKKKYQDTLKTLQPLQVVLHPINFQENEQDLENNCLNHLKQSYIIEMACNFYLENFQLSLEIADILVLLNLEKKQTEDILVHKVILASHIKLNQLSEAKQHAQTLKNNQNLDLMLQYFQEQQQQVELFQDENLNNFGISLENIISEIQEQVLQEEQQKLNADIKKHVQQIQKTPSTDTIQSQSIEFQTKTKKNSNNSSLLAVMGTVSVISAFSFIAYKFINKKNK